MDFISSGWYLRRKNLIVTIKYITHKMKHTLRVKCSTKIVYSFEDFNFIERISKVCVYMFMCTGMFNYFHIHDLLYSCMYNDNYFYNSQLVIVIVISYHFFLLLSFTLIYGVYHQCLFNTCQEESSGNGMAVDIKTLVYTEKTSLWILKL